MKKWLLSKEGRAYMYRIAMAVLGIATIAFAIDAVTREAIESLLAAVLNLGGTANALLAYKNVEK